MQPFRESDWVPHSHLKTLLWTVLAVAAFIIAGYACS